MTRKAKPASHAKALDVAMEKRRSFHALVAAFAGRLFRLRVGKGWTQKHLATLSGVDQANVARFELGQRVPSLAAQIALAQALEVPFDRFMLGSLDD